MSDVSMPLPEEVAAGCRHELVEDASIPSLGDVEDALEHGVRFAREG